MKFIHTGDLHLDSPFRGLLTMPPALWKKIHAATFAAFKKIVDDAITERVDFVLIVGDVYDRERQSIAAKEFFTTQCQRLAADQIPVYLLYGNHDYQLVGEGEDLPTNVHVLENQVSTLRLELANHERVAISGFSYDQRWIEEDVVARYPQRQDDVNWHIGMLHGAVKEQRENHYAPFTTAELVAKKYDYWALGHIHKHQLLNVKPPIVYCGDPQGRHQNEDGQHGYYLVESQQGKLVPTFKPAGQVLWQKLTITAPKVVKLNELEEAIVAAVAKRVSPGDFVLVALTINGVDHLPARLRHLLANGDVLAHLQKRLLINDGWWIFQIINKTMPNMPTMTDLDQRYWQEAAASVFTTNELLDLSSSLTGENFLATYLASLDPADMKRQVLQLLEQGEVPDDY